MANACCFDLAVLSALPDVKNAFRFYNLEFGFGNRIANALLKIDLPRFLFEF
jgi:hypothetical protein